jgi:hypothetical protein
MANVPTPEFQKSWQHRIESVRLECRNTVPQLSDTDAVMELVRAIVHLAGCTSASLGGSPKWTLAVKDLAETRRNMQHLPNGRQQYSVYTQRCYMT